jgi:nicotinamide mononucleotide (NMN) deamidase PncC
LAYVAAVNQTRSVVREYRWDGDRAQNRASSAEAALALIVELLE